MATIISMGRLGGYFKAWWIAAFMGIFKIADTVISADIRLLKK